MTESKLEKAARKEAHAFYGVPVSRAAKGAFPVLARDFVAILLRFAEKARREAIREERKNCSCAHHFIKRKRAWEKRGDKMPPQMFGALSKGAKR